MSALRERINMVIPTSPDSYDNWATVYETEEGGAIMCMDFENHLEVLAKANDRLAEMGLTPVEMDINPRETAFILVDKDNKVVPFDSVMKAFFD